MEVPKNTITVEQMEVQFQRDQEEARKADREFNERKEEARKDVMERIFDCEEPFYYSDIEEIMSSHGLEMDYIEDFLL